MTKPRALGAVLAALVSAPLFAQGKAPVARPGADRRVGPGVIALDGSASFTLSGTRLSYQWSFAGGPVAAKFSSDTTATPSVELTTPGTYTFGLRVYDKLMMSQLSEVAISVDDLPPSCGAGRDALVPTGRVELQGWATDPNRQPVTVNWIQVRGPRPVPLANPTALATHFDVPVDATGVYEFVLRATDGAHTISSSPLRIEVDDPPTSEAYANPGTTDPGQKVDLNGAGSADKNPEDNPLTYAWTQTGGPEPGTLTGADQPYATFTARRPGEYTLNLRVTSKTNPRTADAPVTVKVRNQAPVAQIANPAVGHRDPVDLDGSASSDPNGDPLTYEWKQVGGSGELAFTDPSAPRTRVTSTRPGSYQVQLTVRDGDLDSNPVTATVTFENTAPVPISAPVIVTRPGVIVLDARASVDRDGDGVRYFWRQVDGPQRVRFDDPYSPRPRVGFAFPGTYGFELQVNDGVAYSFPVRVTVNVLR